MPYVQLDEYGLIDENSPCFDCENAYVEDIWYEWMCKAKECPYQKKIINTDKRKEKGGEAGMRLIDAHALQDAIHKSKMQNPHKDAKTATNHEL